MIKKILVMLSLMILFIPIIYAEELVLKIELTVHKNGSINIDDVRLRPGYLWATSPSPKSYFVKLVSSDNKILTEANFYASFTSRPEQIKPSPRVDKVPIKVFLKYFENSEYILVTYNNTEIARYSIIGKLCNNNGVCDGFETYYSCPKDCPLGSKDNVCIKDKDLICDPDCKPEEDPDCAGLKRMSNYLPYIFVTTMLIAIIMYLVYRRHQRIKFES